MRVTVTFDCNLIYPPHPVFGTPVFISLCVTWLKVIHFDCNLIYPPHPVFVTPVYIFYVSG